MMPWTRRSFLASAAALPFASGARAEEPRIVALEWRYADHAASLGLTPVGVADLSDYARQASADEAALRRAATLDMGRRQEPSLEAVIAARPSLILGVGFRHERIKPQLAAIAETILFQYTRTREPNDDQLALMLDELTELGAHLGAPQRAAAAIAAFEAESARLAGDLAARGFSGAKVVCAQFPQGVNAVRLFTPAALPSRLLSRLGLTPAWNGPTEGFGFTTVGPERLLSLGDVHLLGIAVGADNSYARLAKNPLWPSMPFVRAKRFHAMTDVVWPFGGLPAALAFMRGVVEAFGR